MDIKYIIMALWGIFMQWLSFVYTLAFRLALEVLDSVADFIGHELPKRPSKWHV